MGVAVVGCGFMGTVHLNAWSMIPEAKVVAVVEIHPSRAKAVAKKFKAKVFRDLDRAMKVTDVDVVDITTPTFTHKQNVIKAVQAGKQVMVEKPFALTLKDVDEMIAATHKAGVKLMVAHCIRFFAEYAKIKELVSQGSIGEPVISRGLRAGPLPTWGERSWFLDPKKSGGVGIDLAIHDIDFTRWCFDDKVKTVYARVGRIAHKKGVCDDHALFILRFEHDGIAYIQASWAVPQQYPFSTYFEIAGRKGFLSVDNSSVSPITVMSNGKVEKMSPETMPPVPGMPFPIDPYYREVRHFVDCLEGGKEPLTNGEEAKKSLETALAGIRSSKTGSVVKLPLEEN
jgi:predicted dehydrogenase